MNKSIYIVGFLIALVSCKKDYTYDQEAGMETGEAYLLKRATVTDTFQFHLNAEVEMIHFNGYSKNYDYSTNTFTSAQAYGAQTEILSSTIQTSPSSSGYKNLILINTDNLDWLENYAPGYYLERYFDQVENDPTSVATIGSFATNNEHAFTFHSQNPFDAFGNTPFYNTSFFYEITRTTNTDQSVQSPPEDINLKKTILALDAALDSLNNYAEVGTNLVITLFINGGFNFDELIEPLMAALITKSKDYNIPINVVSNYHTQYDVQLALQSGGFYLASFGCFDGSTYVPCFDQRPTSQGILLQNLHNLLRNDYTSHVANIQMSFQDSLVYPVTPNPFCAIKYNEFVFPLTFDKNP